MLATGGAGGGGGHKQSLVLDMEREQMWLEEKRARELRRELKEEPIL